MKWKKREKHKVCTNSSYNYNVSLRMSKFTFKKCNKKCSFIESQPSLNIKAHQLSSDASRLRRVWAHATLLYYQQPFWHLVGENWWCPCGCQTLIQCLLDFKAEKMTAEETVIQQNNGGTGTQTHTNTLLPGWESPASAAWWGEKHQEDHHHDSILLFLLKVIIKTATCEIFYIQKISVNLLKPSLGCIWPARHLRGTPAGRPSASWWNLRQKTLRGRWVTSCVIIMRV